VATKIRLARFGRKKRPFYRIMVSDSRAPRDGRHIDSIGYYNPLTSPKDLKIEKEKAFDWLNRGAIPSLTVRNLLSSQGILLEWELRKQGKSEKIIGEELQKFDFLQDLKQKNKEKVLRSRVKEDAAVEEAPEIKETAAAETEAEETAETQPTEAVEEAISTESEVSSDASVVSEEAKAEEPPEEKPDEEVSESETPDTQSEDQSEPTEKLE